MPLNCDFGERTRYCSPGHAEKEGPHSRRLPAVHLVKATVFPVVMCGCESWTIKKAEHQRIDAFELWSWRRLLRVPWTARTSNQSILKEISPEHSLERTDVEAETPILWPPDTFTFHFHALEKETAAHSSVLAWRIPGTGEPGGLLSM